MKLTFGVASVALFAFFAGLLLQPAVDPRGCAAAEAARLEGEANFAISEGARAVGEAVNFWVSQ